MKQSSFSDLAYEHKKKTTRKVRFLAEMEAILPWDETRARVEHVFGVVKHLWGYRKLYSQAS